MRNTALHIIRGLLLVVLCAASSLTFAQDTAEEVKECYRKGNLYYQQGKYKEAQDEYQKALGLLNGRESAITFPEVVKKPEPTVPVAQPQVSPTAKAAPALNLPPEQRESLEYLIGEEDGLQISVWQNPDLDQEVIVRPDGRISFPLIGDIQAAGLTLTQLDQILTERLREFIKYPEVSLSLKKIGGKKVMVLGEVRSPGVYSVTGARTILEAISLAGGFTKDAVASSTILIRGGFEKAEAKRIDLSKALQGDVRQNIALRSEDIVFVPKKFIANLNYFLDQVLGPLAKGAYTAKELQTY